MPVIVLSTKMRVNILKKIKMIQQDMCAYYQETSRDQNTKICREVTSVNSFSTILSKSDVSSKNHHFGGKKKDQSTWNDETDYKLRIDERKTLKSDLSNSLANKINPKGAWTQNLLRSDFR